MAAWRQSREAAIQRPMRRPGSRQRPMGGGDVMGGEWRRGQDQSQAKESRETAGGERDLLKGKNELEFLAEASGTFPREQKHSCGGN